jgi:hypothetical protein
MLKPRDNWKKNVLFVFKLMGISIAFHASGNKDGVIPVLSKHTCLFHFIGFRGGMVSSTRSYLSRTSALPSTLDIMGMSVL